MSVILDPDELENILRAYKQKCMTMNPWLKIIRAGAKRTGLRLSSSEVDRLCFDDAIQTAAYEVSMDELQMES